MIYGAHVGTRGRFRKYRAHHPPPPPPPPLFLSILPCSPLRTEIGGGGGRNPFRSRNDLDPLSLDQPFALGCNHVLHSCQLDR